MVVTIKFGVVPAGNAEVSGAGAVVEMLKGENFLFTNRADGVFADVRSTHVEEARKVPRVQPSGSIENLIAAPPAAGGPEYRVLVGGCVSGPDETA